VKEAYMREGLSRPTAVNGQKLWHCSLLRFSSHAAQDLNGMMHQIT
jgi:hypothetical protein